jgi:hypothetical protein
MVGSPAPLGSALLGLAAAVGGCMVTTDPTLPCSARDVGKAEVGTVVNRISAPVVAVASSEPYVLRPSCDESSCTVSHAPLLRQGGVALSSGSALLLTSTGNYLVGIDREDASVQVWETGHDGPLAEATQRFIEVDYKPRQLVAGLRNSDVVIARGSGGQLQRLALDENPSLVELAGQHLDLKLVAIGDQNLVAREMHGSDDDTLYLIDASGTPASNYAGPVPLLRGGPFTSVSIAPDDTHVVATTGDGDDAETFVFEIPSGALVDRFSGAQKVGRVDFEVLPGLRSVSPDGSVIAYRTAAGSLALRDIAEQSSCLLRSATSGAHTLAGFAADGTLYFESEIDTGDTRVLAFDLIERHISPLGPVGESWLLAGVPAQRGDASPWAIAVREGVYAALQEGAQAEGVELEEAAFLPRDDEAVWAIDTKIDHTGGVPKRLLSARRIEPVATGERSWSFDDADGAQEVLRTDSLIGTQGVCLSTGAPGAWGYRCGNPSANDFFGGTPLPDSEDPSTDGEGPEVPTSDEEPAAVECAAPGWSQTDQAHDTCPVRADAINCCFETNQDACDALACKGELRCVVTNDNAFCASI